MSHREYSCTWLAVHEGGGIPGKKCWHSWLDGRLLFNPCSIALPPPVCVTYTAWPPHGRGRKDDANAPKDNWTRSA